MYVSSLLDGVALISYKMLLNNGFKTSVLPRIEQSKSSIEIDNS